MPYRWTSIPRFSSGVSATRSWVLFLASPNDIHNSEKLCNRFWSGSAILNAAPLYVSCNPIPTVEIFANSLTTHIKLKSFRSSFQFCWWEQSFWKNSTLVFSLLAAFYKFHWTSKVYATLTMGNRFLGVQISIIWVVFAVKTVTLLWQPAKAQDIARECHSSIVICCWNLLYSHYYSDYQRTSADLGNKHSTPDTWVVEAVYRCKNCICLCVWQRVGSCIIELKRVWNPHL